MKKKLFILLCAVLLIGCRLAMADEYSIINVQEDGFVRTYVSCSYENYTEFDTVIYAPRIVLKATSPNGYPGYPFEKELMASVTWPRNIPVGKKGYLAFEFVRPTAEVDPDEEITADMYSWNSDANGTLPQYGFLGMVTLPNANQQFDLRTGRYVVLDYYAELTKRTDESWPGMHAVVTIVDRDGRLLHVAYSNELAYCEGDVIRIPIDPKLVMKWMETPEGYSFTIGECFTFYE